MSYELTAGQKLICGMAVGRWGWRRQMMKVAEELRELADAVVDAVENVKPDEELEEALVDERADVAVVLYLAPHLTAYVTNQIRIKASRLAERALAAAEEEAK